MSSSTSLPHTTQLFKALPLLLTELSMLRGQQVLKNLCEPCNSSSQGHGYVIITPTQNYSTIDVYWWHFSLSIWWHFSMSLIEKQSMPLSLLSLHWLLSYHFLFLHPSTCYHLSLFHFVFNFLLHCILPPSQKETSLMHVLQTLLYFRINWYWFSPEIRHWLNFNLISLAPKLPKWFQAQSPVVPKAHGTHSTSMGHPRHQGPAKAVWVAVILSQISAWGARGKIRKGNQLDAYFHLFLLQSSGKQNILCFSRKLVQAWVKRLNSHCFSYPSEAVWNNSHPNMLQGINLGRLCSLDSHLGSPAHELPALLQNTNLLLWSMKNCQPQQGNTEKPIWQSQGSFRARCRSHRKHRQDRTQLPAEEICPELSPFSPCWICLLYPWLKNSHKPLHFPQPLTSLWFWP